MAEEIVDLPYRAEYSKSGRASCKACKTPIAKDVLRLAVMVQSPMFDGKIPHWYHFMCFFGKQRPKTVGDISHFESLRWEDQEKIRQKIAAGGPAPAAAASSKAKGKGKKRGADTTGFGDYTVEYAKSGRAMCRGCEEKILKDEVRISKKDYESENARMYGGLDRWHHVECFAKLRSELQFFETGSVLPGFKTLSKEDQKNVLDKLPKIAEVKKEADGDSTDGPTKPKQSKVDTKNEAELKKQNSIMYKYRDNLRTELEKKSLAALLEYNNQEVPSGEDRILDRLADIMTFGALERCPQCKNGQFVYRSGVGYQCLGDLTDWSKCQHVVKEPKRVPFKVPKELKEEHSFLASYKYVPRTRLFNQTAPSTSAVKKEENAGPKVFRPPPPLKDMEFVIVGKTKKGKAELKEEIKKLGGKVVSKVHEKLAAVISNPGEVEKMSSKIEEAKDFDIQVVPEDFLDEVKDGGADIIIQKKSICSWGSDVKSRLPAPSAASKSKSKSGSMFKKSGSSVVKLRVKGGGAVDPDSGLDDVAHVYQEGKDVYNAVLGLTCLQTGKNSFYKLQVLAADTGNRFWCFRAWGRIGTTIGGNKLSEGTKNEMVAEFRALYEEKTGNMWENRHTFTKVPGRMYPIDVDYSQDEDEEKQVNSNVPSKLHKSVQDLVSLLFDVKMMKKVMKEFELDMEKMPLGKLSKRQLQQAMGVLTDLQELIKSGSSSARFIDASNRFYTLIPHDFGVENPPVLNTEELIKQKLEMIDSLMEMEVAYSLLKSSDGESDNKEINPIDAHYEKLKTHIEVLDKDSEEFELLRQYVKNTHGATHTNYELEIDEVFKIQRQGEDKRFKPFRKLHNRKLLWHGSRLTNFAGILSQGLRIAPPEAPSTGYMFGKGIYFADMVSKSANYCFTSPTNPTGLMLLCEVALGNMYERPRADYIEKLPKGMHSTKGLGMNEPDPSQVVVKDGVEIPLGKGIPTNRNNVALYYNEYIIYDVAQVNMKYLLKMKFKYNY
ncbi:poly [ADP-ribose] polymerase [Anabrus simplex]|uniref:poly [ADP-ribose] polymerase n=1 Tax=Anabrus simplex TaxID=316456 RepID=UPI0035A35C07